MDDGYRADVERLLRQQAALAAFGSFAFQQPSLLATLTEAARVCAEQLSVEFCKVCRYRPKENDLLIEAGCGWQPGVVGRVVSQADESSPQGRAYITGQPVVIRNLYEANDLQLPEFYAQHGIVSTIDVLIPGLGGVSWGVLEIDSPDEHTYDVHDIAFLTAFANVLSEAVATATRIAELRALVEQKDMLAQELQHRVRNNLQLVNSMLVSYARTASDPAARRGIDAIVRRVTTLAQVYDHLLGTGMERTIDFGKYLCALCDTLPELQEASAHTVELVCDAAPVLLDLDAVTALGMAVAELVTNSYGHAFPDRGGRIDVVLAAPDGTGTATLTIADDGVGFETGEISKRRGLGLVRRLVQQAQGRLDVRSGPGTTWTLSFRVPDEADLVRSAA